MVVVGLTVMHVTHFLDLEKFCHGRTTEVHCGQQSRLQWSSVEHTFRDLQRR